MVDTSATPSPASSVASASESAAPSGPYAPATSKHPARDVPAPRPLPKVAKEKNKVGQLAFTEHWFKELNYAWETGASGTSAERSLHATANTVKQLRECLPV